MPTYVIQHEFIPEYPGPGRLGRNWRVDSRSAAFPYRPRAAAVASVTWDRHLGILDQGQVGSCTGEMMCGACACDPLFAGLPPALAQALGQPLALKFYSEAETIDGHGVYPPNDYGSSGGSVCQSAKTDGYISGYAWASSAATAADALQHGPVGFGTYWYSSFDAPPASGIVKITTTAKVRGGHEYLCRQYDQAAGVFWCDNSWGTSWGKAGRFGLAGETVDTLLSRQGDCVVPTPLAAPAPVPVPTPPAADAADLALNAAIAAWQAAKGL
jgi:hypothetical protein